MALPFVRDLFADVEKLPAFSRVTSHLRANTGRMRVSGLTPAAKTLLLSLWQKVLPRPLLFIVRNNEASDEVLPVVRAFSELVAGASPDSVVSLPARDVLPFENLSPHPEIQEQRAISLWKIATGAASVVIAPVASTTLRLQSPEYYSELARTLRRGESFDTTALIGHLNTVGYASTDVVEMPGEYALRGGILDVYSPEGDRPVRIEFFGDEVESIRKFDPATQRSSSPADEVVLLPFSETPVREDVLSAIHARLLGKRVSGAEAIVEQAARAAGAAVFPGWEFYAPVHGWSGTIFDLMPAAAVIADEPELVRSELDQFWERVEGAHERSGIGNLVRPLDLYISPEEWRSRLARLPGLELEHLGVMREGGEAVEFHSQPSPRFHGSIPFLVEDVKRNLAGNRRVLVAAPNTGELERLVDFFTEYGVSFRLGSRTRGGESYADETAYFSGEVVTATLVKAYIPDGVILPDAALAIFGTRDLFDESESVVSRPQRQKSKISAFLSDFRDLEAGDYVVHVEHGIGQYQGLKEINQGDGNAEFMVLEYAEGAKLYVPLTRLDLVQKYRSQEGVKPALNHLGTAAWAKTKARVRKAMQDMTEELIELYAQRKTAKGHSFAADNEWMREFEDAFEYSETEDQDLAIRDVKRDMESPQPMDRLLCGDVGYGKTEVAMRAAFKAISDNKQVAVLAP
ncbi:MAG: transcription-repair coupling factor, partial [Acidobacteria bacterium]|nr:transcription-repair coupling factor [Acidobacteriota bacterium]